MKEVKIGKYTLGKGHPPFFVAELGICHEGRLDVALELTRAAVAAGAHCIKTETFQRENLVYSPEATTSYEIWGETYEVSLSEHMERYELSLDEHYEVRKECTRLGVPFMSTAHDFEAVDFLADIEVDAVKVASPDIVHYPLLRHIAAKRLPVFLDTGSAHRHEIIQAVNLLRRNELEDVVVNHNPKGHPALAGGHALLEIPLLADILQIPIGLADHYEGYEMLYAAVAAGAGTVEKPISRDRFVKEPERNWSISVEDLPGVIRNVQAVFEAVQPKQEFAFTSTAYRSNNRMACVAKRDLLSGDEVNFDNFTFGRPQKGIGVELWDLVEGRKLRSSLTKHEFLNWEHL